MVTFDYELDGKVRTCLYRVNGDRITVIVEGTKSIAYLDGLKPDFWLGFLRTNCSSRVDIKARHRRHFLKGTTLAVLGSLKRTV